MQVANPTARLWKIKYNKINCLLVNFVHLKNGWLPDRARYCAPEGKTMATSAFSLVHSASREAA
jgi:hypothetical protein